jgi:hypothetical protein
MGDSISISDRAKIGENTKNKISSISCSTSGVRLAEVPHHLHLIFFPRSTDVSKNRRDRDRESLQAMVMGDEGRPVRDSGSSRMVGRRLPTGAAADSNFHKRVRGHGTTAPALPVGAATDAELDGSPTRAVAGVEARSSCGRPSGCGNEPRTPGVGGACSRRVEWRRRHGCPPSKG